MVQLPAVRDSTLPFVTFYDESTGERTELSLTSLRNWEAKTANYLRDGFGIQPGARVSLDLPPHWVVTVWLAACRSLGVTIELAPTAAAHPELAVIGPESIRQPPLADDVVACSLRPLAQPFTATLPVGIEDFFAEVRGYGDHFSVPSLNPALPLLDLGAGRLDAAAIQIEVNKQLAKLRLSTGARVLVTDLEGDDATTLNAAQLLAMYDLPRAIGGSVVIVVNANPKQIAAIADQERVTAQFGP